MKELLFYATPSGRVPILQWLKGLKDPQVKQRIEARFLRVVEGNFGDCKPVGEGVRELRFHFGAGYRVYFAEDGDLIVVLLCGGDKSSQINDIERAKEFWHEYLATRGGDFDDKTPEV